MSNNKLFGSVRRQLRFAILMFLYLSLMLPYGTANAASPGTLKWKAEGGANAFNSPAAIGSDGTVYTVHEDGNLYAFLPDNGTPKWTLLLDTGNNGFENSPTIGPDGTIYVVLQDGRLFAVADNGNSGAVKWQYPAKSANDFGVVMGSPAIAPDGTVYIGSNARYLYAISPPKDTGTVGRLKWSCASNSSNVDSSPAIGADGTIYVVSWAGYLLALQDQGTKCSRKWRYPSTDDSNLLSNSSPAIGPDGTIYFGARNMSGSADIATLYAVNPLDGSPKWTFPMDSGELGIEFQSPVIAPNGTIYIGTAADSGKPGYLYAVTDSGPQGTLKWKYAIRPGYTDGDGNALYFGVNDTPAIDSNGAVYFGASDGWVYALSDNGSEATRKWRYPVTTVYDDGTFATGIINSSPILGSDGSVYIGGAGVSNFYAINGDSNGSAVSAWPMFHHDSFRTGQSLADLVETYVSDPPATSAAGKSFAINDTVKNQSLIGPSNAVTQTRFYLSATTTKDGSSILLTGSRSVPIVATNGTSTGTDTTLTVPIATPTGTYHLIACADDTNLIRETDKNNNCITATGTIAIEQNVDLVVSSIGNPPATASSGDSFTITDSIKNQGTGSAGASTTRYYFSASGTKIMLTGSQPVPALGASKSFTGAVKLTIPDGVAAGNYNVLACADDLGAVGESDESNNCMASAKTVSITIRALNLVEQSVTAATKPATSPVTVVLGKKFLATDTILNQGNVKIRPTTTLYYFSASRSKDETKPLTGKRAVPALAPGKSNTGKATLTVPKTIPVGSYYLIACADSFNKISESNEDDNCAASESQINVTAPDLVESASTDTTAVSHGGKIVVTGTVTNSGNAAAPASTSRYYLDNGSVRKLLSAARPVPALAAGTSSPPKQVKVTIPQKTTPGSYNLLVCADGLQKMPESNETNNCSSVTITVQ